MTTIPRNHTRVIAALKAQYPYAVAHRKDDAYTARVVDAQTAWDALAAHPRAALTRQADRLKIIYALGWFDLFTDADAHAATLSPKPTADRAPVVDVLNARAVIGQILRRTPESGQWLASNLRSADGALSVGGYAQARASLHTARLELLRTGREPEAEHLENIKDELTARILCQRENGGGLS